MSAKQPARRFGLALRLALLIISVTSLIFAAAFGYNYQQTKALLLKNVENSAKSLTQATVSKIEEALHSLQTLPDTVAQGYGSRALDRSQSLVMLADFMRDNREAYGGGIFLEEHARPGGERRESPYFVKKNGRVTYDPLSEDYAYDFMDWYMLPKHLARAEWSEPYYDEAGGNILMATYAAPIWTELDGEKLFSGVVTVDISLESLQTMVAKLHPGISGYAFLVSRTGRMVSHPNRALIMRSSVFSRAEEADDPDLRAVGRSMVRGEQGFARLGPKAIGKTIWIYYAPLPSTGWSLGLVIPEDDLFADLTELHRDVVLIGAGGFAALLLLVVLIAATVTRPIRQLARKTIEIAKGNLDVDLPVVNSGDEVGDLSRSFHEMRRALKEYIANLTETTKAKERMESELKIAKNIQMSFLPKRFPPFPDITAFCLHAHLEPAYEVGGDLYDFFLIDENRLFISVGDVSGKGVPAALFMAVTKTLTKGIAEQDPDPAVILAKVNNELAEENDAMLFVTMFCGILDFRTGELFYSNAGHNQPVLLRPGQEPVFLDLPPGTAMGPIPDLEYVTRSVVLEPGDVLVAYTDGVNESQNESEELMGNERFLDILRKERGRTPEALTGAVFGAVHAFAGAAPQADDITVLTLAWNGPGKGSCSGAS